MNRFVKVILWDEEIGRLSWDKQRKISYFVFNPKYVKNGIDISPIVAPINRSSATNLIWGEEAKIYQKLPAFLADSLPDSWGSQLFELWRQENHLANSDITPLDKLSFIGKRAMGALEFIPETFKEKKIGQRIDINALADLAEKVFKDKEKVRLLPEESITMQSLLTVGTSAGGRQPKAIIAINHNTGEIRSGQISDLDGYDYYILKFGDSLFCSAELEMTYYELAKFAGIKMMNSSLFTVEGKKHFITERFDRKDGEKVFTQTLAAICPKAESYEDFITVCRKLNLPESDCQEVFRRMIFNILANNTDDHNKNFSFIMTKSGSWHLSPAYDMNYVVDRAAYLPNKDHCLYIRAKLSDIKRTDVIEFAKDNGIRHPNKIISEVANALKQFRAIATKNNVSNIWIGRVENTINKYLKEWGEIEDNKSHKPIIIGGSSVDNIKLEQALKGNYHLYAEIDGRERKFVIARNKEEYALIDNIGLANLGFDFLLKLVEKYLSRYFKNNKIQEEEE